MEEINKQRRIQNAAISLFQEQGVDETSVNEIVKRASVAKGTFYVYYKDKKELITQILSQKQGHMINEILHRAKIVSIEKNVSWGHAFVTELLQYYKKNPNVLVMIQKNINVLPDTVEHRKQIFCYVDGFEAFLEEIKRGHECLDETLCRFMLMMEVASVVCHNAIIHHMPCEFEAIQTTVLSTLMHIIDEKESRYDL